LFEREKFAGTASLRSVGLDSAKISGGDPARPTLRRGRGPRARAGDEARVCVEIEVERPEGTPESGEEELISIEGEEEIAWEEEEGANLEAQEDPSDRAAGHP
jgi:hypothetical protein